MPASALRLAVVYSGRTGYHAVLTVPTDKGALVLGNLNDKIESWNGTKYFWISAQDAANPMQWNSLETAIAQAPANDGVAAVPSRPSIGR